MFMFLKIRFLNVFNLPYYDIRPQETRQIDGGTGRRRETLIRLEVGSYI